MSLLLIVILVISTAVLGLVLYIQLRVNNGADKNDYTRTIDKTVNQFFKGRLPNALLVGIYKNKAISFHSYGKENPDHTTLFQIGSLSKLFTSALLLILDKEGTLDKNTSLEAILGDQYELSAEAKKVTLYQLATHTSGFPRVPETLLTIVEKNAINGNPLADPYLKIELTDVLEYLKTTQGKQKPGKFEYSNYGMGLLGHILEMVTHKNLEALAQEKLLAPLGMKNTAITLPSNTKTKLTQGYDANGKKAKPWTFTALGGAGAFNSNVTDLMQFVKANIDDQTALSTTLINMQKTIDKKSMGWMHTSIIEKLLGNKTMVWHNGMVGGYASYMAIDREREAGLVMLSSQAVDITLLGHKLINQVRAKVQQA